METSNENLFFFGLINPIFPFSVCVCVCVCVCVDYFHFNALKLTCLFFASQRCLTPVNFAQQIVSLFHYSFNCKYYQQLHISI